MGGGVSVWVGCDSISLYLGGMGGGVSVWVGCDSISLYLYYPFFLSPCLSFSLHGKYEVMELLACAVNAVCLSP